MTMYRIEDSRTGRLVSVASFFTEAQAWARMGGDWDVSELASHDEQEAS